MYLLLVIYEVGQYCFGFIFFIVLTLLCSLSVNKCSRGSFVHPYKINTLHLSNHTNAEHPFLSSAYKFFVMLDLYNG